MAAKKKPKKPKKKRVRPFIREPEPPTSIIHVEYKRQHELTFDHQHALRAAVQLIAENGGMEYMDANAVNFFVHAVRAKDYLGAIQVYSLWREKKVKELAVDEEGLFPPEIIIETMTIGVRTRTPKEITAFVERKTAEKIAAGISL